MSSVLYQNVENDIFLVDIPASIAEAQNFGDERPRLKSCLAVEQPWPNNEPKSEQARAKLKSQQPEDEVEVQTAIEYALAAVQTGHHGPYCYPRSVATTPAKIVSKRARSHSPDHPASGDTEAHCKPDWTHWRDGFSEDNGDPKTGRSGVISTDTCIKSLAQVGELLVSNATSSTVKVGLRDTSVIYSIPSRSSFFLGDCSRSVPFHRSISRQAREQDRKRHFDIVVMDPPWPSASVRRGAQKGQAHYSVIRTLEDMRSLLMNMDLQMLLGDSGLLAVWITNKPAVRDMMLAPDDGLFARCNVQLIEEWSWVKVTTKGEPVLPVKGLWRKPYEVLLIGKKRQSSDALLSKVKRRVVIAVPDLHSRKPCLKAMLSQVFKLPSDHRGLEIFARNLVSGWHSWGNEVLKFNDTACWTA